MQRSLYHEQAESKCERRQCQADLFGTSSTRAETDSFLFSIPPRESLKATTTLLKPFSKITFLKGFEVISRYHKGNLKTDGTGWSFLP
jgi:hypothetical protein